MTIITLFITTAFETAMTIAIAIITTAAMPVSHLMMEFWEALQRFVRNKEKAVAELTTTALEGNKIREDRMMKASHTSMARH